jgi:hypothetical protein
LWRRSPDPHIAATQSHEFNSLTDRVRIGVAPEAQCLLAPRFSVGTGAEKLLSPVGAVQNAADASNGFHAFAARKRRFSAGMAILEYKKLIVT